MAFQTAFATFNSAQPLDGDYPYIDVTWSVPYASSSSYRVFKGEITSGAAVIVNFKSKAAGTIRVIASDQWTGTVELVAVDA